MSRWTHEKHNNADRLIPIGISDWLGSNYMNTELIDISHLEKADILAALYNSSRPLGMGFMHFEWRLLLCKLRANIEPHYKAEHGIPLKYDAGWAWEMAAFIENHFQKITVKQMREHQNAALCDPAHGDAGKPKTL